MQTFDFSATVGLVVIGVVSGLAIIHGGPTGLTVAAGGIGAIGGWLTKGALTQRADKITNTTSPAPADAQP